MKRLRTTRVSGTSKCGKELGEAEEDQNSNFGYHSITELPRCISIDILLRRSVNRLLICRCVCKTWRYLISDLEFAKLHFAKGEIYPLIRSLSGVQVSRTLHLVEPPDPCINFKAYCGEGCTCENSWLLCEVHPTPKLDTKLKIPLRNSDLAINTNCEADAKIQSKTDSKRKRCMKLRPKDHRFNIVNSCNGLLCLSEPKKNDPVAVCNPITGEYINLPIPTQDTDKYKPWVDCALGFSPQSNQYKVIRMFSQGNHQWFQDPITGKEKNWSHREAEMHVLGTSSWRRIGHVPLSCSKLEYPTFLNGALHWVSPSSSSSDYIISFDFVGDKFQPIPTPQEVQINREHDLTLGIVRGCLCMCSFDFDDRELDVWVMEDYGVKRSWTKKYCISPTTDYSRWLLDLNEPTSVLSNGGVLLFHRKITSLLFHQLDGWNFNYLLKVRGRGEKYKFEAIHYVPSFISLKDAVAGEEVEVMNINSRCGGLKLLGESQTLYSQEADAESDLLDDGIRTWNWDLNFESDHESR